MLASDTRRHVRPSLVASTLTRPVEQVTPEIAARVNQAAIDGVPQ
jgi:hypothetical protein